MLTNKDLVAKYAYLDELDGRGWAWEFLRRNDGYRADYDRLQTLRRPEPFDSEHAALVNKWHVRCLLHYRSDEIPKFFHEVWEKITIESDPIKWRDVYIEKKPPQFNPETWKRSIVCKDLRDHGCSLNETARRLYPGFEGNSHDTRHEPARHRVQGDLKRLKKLQEAFLKIAYSGW